MGTANQFISNFLDGENTVITTQANTLFGWGDNSNGSLGTFDLNIKLTPVQIYGGGSTWQTVSHGSYFGAGIKTDGTLWTWGWNATTTGAGALGTNDTINRSTPVQTAIGGTNWSKVSGGYGTLAAIKTDGTLWLCGDNVAGGALGTNDTLSRSTPTQTAVGGTNWIQVSTTYDLTAAVKTDGTLWTWGANFFGQLGTNDRV